MLGRRGQDNRPGRALRLEAVAEMDSGIESDGTPRHARLARQARPPLRQLGHKLYEKLLDSASSDDEATKKILSRVCQQFIKDEPAHDCSSSDEERIVGQPVAVNKKIKINDLILLKNENEKERTYDPEEIPLMPQRSLSLSISMEYLEENCSLPLPDGSPGKSSLYEVELTASDEDDDASLLEVVFPLQHKINGVSTTQKKDMKLLNRIYRIFCCMS